MGRSHSTTSTFVGYNFLAIILVLVSAVSKREGDFYPYGQHVGDKELSAQNEDSTSEEIRFPKPVYFFGVSYRSVHVNENGLISFEADVPYFQNHHINRSDYSVIAPFYADVDIRNPAATDGQQSHGHIYYRISEDQELRERATRFVRSKFADSIEFEAKWLLIATWDEVGYYDGQQDKKNTFQTVLIASESQSYVEFLYDDEGVQWTSTMDKSGTGQTIPAQVGFVSDDGRHKFLEYSGSEQIAHIHRQTNIGENGRYLYRVSGSDILGPSEASVRSERLQPLDIGGPSGVVGAGTHSANPDSEDMDEDENDYDIYDHGDGEIVYDDGNSHQIRPGNRGGQPEEPTPAPLAPAPPAPGPDGGAQLIEDTPVQERTPVPEPAPTPAPSQGRDDLIDTTDDDEEDEDDADDHPVPQPEPQPTSEPQPHPVPSGHDQYNPPRPEDNDNVPRHPQPQQPQQPHVPDHHRPHQPHHPPPPPPPPQPAPHVPHHGGPVAPGMRCAQGGSRMCHASAECRDYDTGSCCECQYGFIGNGKECLKEGDPQRINGRFYGRINEIDIPETDLHTYVVTSDGRAYTALSGIPEELGRSLLLLGTLGSVFGWLYAKPTSPNAYNGFQLTGGVLNRTATVHLSDRYTVTIQQEFSEMDSFQNRKAKIYVTGNLPEVAEGVDIDYGDYREDYTRHGPGIVKSYTTKMITAGHDRYQLTIDQTIRFEECQHKPFNKHHTTTLQVDRSYNVYDPKERIVRYAAANSVEMAGDSGPDPCQHHDCTGPQMSCMREGQSYRCTCMTGYELTPPRNEADGRHGTCLDMDECARSLDRCDPEADCANTEGGYQCVCRPGFRGDGYTCTREVECGGVVCDSNAECLPAPSTQLPECVCMVGFEGDGQHCRSLQPVITRAPPFSNHSGHHDSGPASGGPTCTSHDQCHRHGECVYNQAISQYQCQCRPPYSGDGRHCFLEAESCDKARNCDANADCIWTQTEIGGGYQCRCRQGYSGDGRHCTRDDNNRDDVQCNVVNNCHAHAQCKFNSLAGRFTCQCLTDYEGDGFHCTPKTRTPTGDRRCHSVEDCHAYGHCVNQNEEYVCECLPGFKGDGIASCEPADQCNPGSPNSQCDTNAACLYDDQESAYICKCNDGFHGDGKSCREGAAGPASAGQHFTQAPNLATCDRDPNICHRDAQCIWDRTGGHVCQCRPGFRGDGVSSCEADKTSCESRNICHPHAQCQRNRAGEHRCVCNAGYEGDGVNCHPAQDCLINQKLCDANAVCVSENFRYVCKCKPGYHGSGLTCSADSEQRGRTLVFTQGVALVQRGLSSEDLGKQIAVVPHQIAVGLDYDCQDDKLFWTDVSGHAIRSSYTDGSNLTTLFSEVSGLNSPEGLVVDWASKNVYYTDSQLDIIGVARQDGKYRMSLVKEGLVNPRGLALDLFERKLYYSDWYRQKPVIGRLNLDGTGREDFVTQEIALPNGLVVLHRRRQLCWADAGTQRLECIGLNGGGRRVIYAPLGYPFGLTIHNEETFYWTDWEDTKIHTVNINGGNHHAFIPSVGGSGKLYGIVLIPEQCPPGESACSVNNGGCRFICLPDSRGSRSCVCPDNIPESECNELNGGTVSLI